MQVCGELLNSRFGYVSISGASNEASCLQTV